MVKVCKNTICQLKLLEIPQSGETCIECSGALKEIKGDNTPGLEWISTISLTDQQWKDAAQSLMTNMPWYNKQKFDLTSIQSCKYHVLGANRMWFLDYDAADLITEGNKVVAQRVKRQPVTDWCLNIINLMAGLVTKGGDVSDLDWAAWLTCRTALINKLTTFNSEHLCDVGFGSTGGSAGGININASDLESLGEGPLLFTLGHETGHIVDLISSSVKYQGILTGNDNYDKTNSHQREYFADAFSTVLLREKGRSLINIKAYTVSLHWNSVNYRTPRRCAPNTRRN